MNAPCTTFGTLLLWLPHDMRAGKRAISHMRTRSIDPFMTPKSHLYLGVTHPLLLPEATLMFAQWGFTYKTVFCQIQQELQSDQDDGYFSLVTTPLLFGVRGKLRTFAAGRRQPNVVRVEKHQHGSRELYEVIEACSPGPFLEISENPPDRSTWKHWPWKVFLHTHGGTHTNDIC